ncbi:pyridoxamine 5'-phosphate oxidase [Legionella santicrucis]|uniref:Pyridoxamine 5'-phosphate oxidase n=2 Tax=Legionella santicrucis TaxID=45074 RepID=A0A0W0Y928_9GAMM|nr:pyridoxamine 5'-phosphate oxidase [Legionella santicrucis]
MNNPINILLSWIDEERTKGAPDPKQAVLSTTNLDSVPHGRVVAIREINDNGFLFFTQKDTRKYVELTSNPLASITFWFELFEREVMIDGSIIALSAIENENYWNTYSPVAQIRFHSYAPTSAQPITNKQLLEDKRNKLAQQDQPLPVSDYYCGFRLIPSRMVFYTYRTDELSDVIEYCSIENKWQEQLLSP